MKKLKQARVNEGSNDDYDYADLGASSKYSREGLEG
jgi:hypothetical protein